MRKSLIITSIVGVIVVTVVFLILQAQPVTAAAKPTSPSTPKPTVIDGQKPTSPSTPKPTTEEAKPTAVSTPTPDTKPTAFPTPTKGSEESKPTAPPTPTTAMSSTLKPTAPQTPTPSPSPLPTSTATSSPTPTPTPAPLIVNGRVFDDQDGDGIQDSGEPGVAGVAIKVNGRVVTATEADGSFSFPLEGGAKGLLSIIPPEGWSWTGEALAAEEVSSTNSITIAMHRMEPAGSTPAATTTAITATVLVLIIGGGLAFVGLSGLLQAAAVNRLERTYRRHKTLEAERAEREEITTRVREVQAALQQSPEAWRDVIDQLLVDAGIRFDRASLDMGEARAAPAVHFVVAGGGPEFVFTPDPERLQEEGVIRSQDQVVPLDASASRFARVEAQAVWDHVASNVHDGQISLQRSAPWYLVVRSTESWKPKRKWRLLRRLGLRR